MIKENVLRDFPTWNSEKQLKEYQAYKALGDYSPFNDEDYTLMEIVMNNPNAEAVVECEDGVCEIVSEIVNENEMLIEISQKAGAKMIDDTTKRDKVIHLLDIIFDDSGDILPDNSKLKAPTLLSALNKLISDLSKSKDSKSKIDIFFDKNNSTISKNIDPSILKLIQATKIDKVKFSKDNKIGKLLKDKTGENGTITFQELLSIPVIKLLIFLASTGKKSLDATDKKIVFGTDNMKIISSSKGLNNKITTFTRKIGQVLVNILDGVSEYEADKIAEIEKNETMTDEEKDLEKLKIIGVEKNEKETLGKKIANEIEQTPLNNKRKLILEKMEYDTDIINEFMNSINKNDDLSNINVPLTSANVVDAINSRWKSLKGISITLAENLFNKKFQGEGKGERLIEFLFPTISVNGGGESFDLKGSNGSEDFEVKAYQFDGEIVKPIKLGVEGKATKSNLYNEIQVIVSRLQNIFSNPKHYEVLKFMINGVDDETELKELVSNISLQLTSKIPHTSKTFKEALSSGEFSANAIQSVNNLLKDLHKLFTLIKNNKFFYMKVIGKKNEIYKIKSTEIESTQTIFTAEITDISKEEEQSVINDIIDVLGNKTLSNDTSNYFSKVLEELENIVNKDFQLHPMVLLYDTGDNNSDGKSNGIGAFDKIVEGMYTDFKVQAITRGNVAIMPKSHFDKKFN